MNIRDESVLVTGASRGLGKEVARELAHRGAAVVMVARSQPELEAAADEIARGAPGARVHALAFDVGEKEAVHRIAGATAALIGSPSIVIHNASSLGPLPMPLLLDLPCEDLEQVLAVNLVGPFRLTKALAGPMLLAQRGLFLFLSSDAAVSAYSGWGAYGVSKAAQDHLARSFAAELDPIRFLSIDPGEMDTKMHADALPGADPTTLARPSDVARSLARIIERCEEIPNGSRIAASDFTRAERGAAA